MSTCWYLHSFSLDRFKQVFGSATPEQEEKLLEFIEDSDEGYEDDDERELAVLLAKKILHGGISYKGKREDEKVMLDDIVTRAFHEMGLGEELREKPISPEPVTLDLAEELIEHASPGGLISFLSEGRRFGTNEPAALLMGYFILTADEVRKLKSEVDELIANPSIQWKWPQVPEQAKDNISQPLGKIAGKSNIGLYAVLT